MRFATLVALAVVVSSTPGLAAPAPYTLHRPSPGAHHAHPKRDTATTDVDNIVDALVQNSTISADVGTAITKLVNDTLPEFEKLLGYAANSTAANSTQTSKRGATSEIVQAIEAAFDGLILARKRDVITTALQDLLEEAGSLSGNFKRGSADDDTSVVQFDERAFKIPASVTTWLKNLGNVASIGAGGAAIVGALDGSSNSTKREWNTAIDGIGLEGPPADSSVAQFDERAFKIPASVTTWLKNLGNIASIGAGGAAIVGAFDGSSNSTKREWNTAIDGIGLERPPTDSSVTQFDERAFKIPASVTTWLKDLGNVASIGAGGAAIVGAIDGSSNSTKREWNTAIDGIGLERPPADSSVTQFDERAFKIPASVTTWLKNLGNVASIGAGGAAIVGAFDGSSNSTKREWNTAIDGIGLERPPADSSVTQFDERAFKIPASVTTWLKNLGNVASIGAGGAAIVGALDGSNNSTKREFVGVDLTTLLDGVTPQFEDRSVSSGEVSGLESVLGKLAGVASVGGAIASVLSAFEGSSNSTKRELGFSEITSFLEGPPVITSPQHSSVPPTVASKKRSIPSDAESILQQITAVLEGAIGGLGSTSASTKRFTSDGGVFGLTDNITPEQLQQISAHLNATRMADLD